MDNILEVKNLKKYYPTESGVVKAVDGVSFSIPRGTTLGLVGESGCGKSTTGRLILRLGGEKTDGQVLFDGIDVYALGKKELRQLRPKMQIVFQDPFSSLSPRMPVGEILKEAVWVHKLVPRAQLEGYIDGIMDSCGLQPFHKNRYPHEFSGGQRQRISIARALAMQPEFIVCDEPVSALDVSVQAQIVNLLRQLQQERKLSYLFISHDLSVVEHITHRVGVMYLGNLVELAPTQELYKNPLHPYTQALFSSILMPDPGYKPDPVILTGTTPSPADPPRGCKFHPRCPRAMGVCTHKEPRWQEFPGGHFCACHWVNMEATSES